MPRLSDQLISKLKQPKTSTERFFVRDTLLNGFSIRVSSKSITFVLHKQPETILRDVKSDLENYIA
ncbi:MAG: hypothetical protein B7X60_03720 [Polynucleobacter sp. 39-45-136]|nr:MAG: hypothetical protein B7X60_03720 [Polynucleobacter sp. 39-45-136]